MLRAKELVWPTESSTDDEISPLSLGHGASRLNPLDEYTREVDKGDAVLAVPNGQLNFGGRNPRDGVPVFA